jgi:hypothetical protein
MRRTMHDRPEQTEEEQEQAPAGYEHGEEEPEE